MPILQYIRTHNSQDTEDLLTEVLSGKIIKTNIHKKIPKLNASRILLSHIDLWSCAYSRPITLNFPEGDYFRIQLQSKGSGSTTIGGKKFGLNQKFGVISKEEANIHFGDEYEQDVIRINKASLTKKIYAYTGEPVTNDLTFEPIIDRKNSTFTLLQSNHTLIRNVIKNSYDVIPRLISEEMQQSLLLSMLFALKSNYSNKIFLPKKSAAPQVVKKIEEYIKHSWD